MRIIRQYLSAISAFLVVLGAFPMQSQEVKEGQKPPKAMVILGNSRASTDELLKGWRTRESARSTASRKIIYYIKDVEVVVSFQQGKAIGVAVVDKPGVGISPIPQKRYEELVTLIGASPKTKDLVRDSSGIREFYIGDTD